MSRFHEPDASSGGAIASGPPATSRLRVLVVEDCAGDVELMVRALADAGYTVDWQCVDTEAAFREKLDRSIDLVLSDYTLPKFSGLKVLEVVKGSGLPIPVIIVSGTIGEETAVATIKHGAADYLLKDRLARMGPAVAQALEQTRLRLEQAKVKEALQRSEQDFRLMFANNPMPMWVFDVETLRFLAVNSAACLHYGYTEGEFLGMTIKDIRAPSEVPALLEYMQQRATKLDRAGVWRHRTKDGRDLLVEITSHPLRFQERPAELVLANDVTRQMEAQAALHESESRFRQVVENIREVFWLTDVEKTRLLYVSPRLEAIWGRPVQALIDSPGLWLETVHPEDRARVANATRQQQVGGGSDEVYRILRPDSSIRWLRDQAFPVKDSTGAVTRIVGIAEDITERKNLESQFLRAQRMEAIGSLAGGIAHDLNNILAPMLMAVGLLEATVKDERDRHMLAMVERSARRGADIIRQLLAFSRGIEGARAVLQPRHVLREVITIVRETFPREITLQEEIVRDLWAVTGDVTQLHQVVVNLCVNARDAMPNGGTLTLKAANLHIDEQEAARHPNAKPGDYVTISVRDTGVGITPEIMERMFDPFFTTKDVGKGTGLGLSTVMAIVTNHGGFVTVDSEVGRGSVFQVYLPAARENAATESSASASQPPPQGAGELILLVDDEESIREAVRLVLEKNNYRVVTAANGQEAVTVFLKHRDHVRLVLTDMMMPEMGGAALVRLLRVLNPRLKFVAMSGLGSREQSKDFASLGETEILMKPCTPEILLASVHTHLRGRTGAPTTTRSG